MRGEDLLGERRGEESRKARLKSSESWSVE